uniref:SH3 domain-containing protein n=1 Tax=Pavo cristatus TaxID=9049 RepID=A0A8C9FWQ0_PAVCR
MYLQGRTYPLGFRSGDIVEVLDSSNPSWWKGRLRGELGQVPRRIK